MNTYIQSQQAEFNNVIDFFKKDLTSFRTGRANPNMLDGVTVEAYGTQTPINGVAGIALADARCIVVTPWDKGVIKGIEKAIIEANLGLGVVNEGDKIRVTVPPMTEENRRDLVKKINERQEKSKISVRQIREEIKNVIEEASKDKEIGEDDKFKFIKELDEFVASKNEEIKDIRDKKEKDIMEI